MRIAGLLIVAALSTGTVVDAPQAAGRGTTCGSWTRSSLPDWFQLWFRSVRVAQTHEIACYLNPFYVRGDFDGAGELDLAVLVVQKSTGKRGILVVHRPDMTAHLLGAGTSFGNGGDDFYWMGYWRVEQAPRKPNVWDEPLPALKGEALYVAKPEAASAWIGWNGRGYVWYQGAD